MKSTGPSSEMYFQAVTEIAVRTLKEVGLYLLREWCEGNGCDSVVKYIKEQIEFSSWIQSDYHVALVVRHTRHNPFPGDYSKTPGIMRNIAVRAMLDDLKDESKKLVESNAPKYWKLRLVKANRFVVYGDFEEDDSLVDYKAIEPEIYEAKALLEGQYIAAKLSVPEIVLVGFNAAHEEIKS
jgi:hypothetical protein